MIELMRKGVVEALREHKREGRSVVTWNPETNQIVEVPASDISLTDEFVETHHLIDPKS